MPRPVDRPHDTLRNIVGNQGGNAVVDLFGPVLVAAEAHFRKLGFDEAGSDIGHTHRGAVEFNAQCLGDHAGGMLGGGVAGPVGVGFAPRDGCDVHNMPAPFGEFGQQCAGHAHQAEDIGLVHAHPVVVAGFGDRLESECPAGVVHQDLDRVRELFAERVNGIGQGDIERDGGSADFRSEFLETIDPACADKDMESGGGEVLGAGFADSAGRAGDHGNA